MTKKLLHLFFCPSLLFLTYLLNKKKKLTLKAKKQKLTFVSQILKAVINLSFAKFSQKKLNLEVAVATKNEIQKKENNSPKKEVSNNFHSCNTSKYNI